MTEDSGNDFNGRAAPEGASLTRRGENAHPESTDTEPRNDVDATATIRLVNMGADIPGRILDISSGGCRIRTDRPFQVGIFRRVETEFRIKGLPFRLGGVTQTIYDPFNVGIRFVDMSDRKREQLLQLIEEIQEHGRSAEQGKRVKCALP